MLGLRTTNQLFLALVLYFLDFFELEEAIHNLLLVPGALWVQHEPHGPVLVARFGRALRAEGIAGANGGLRRLLAFGPVDRFSSGTISLPVLGLLNPTDVAREVRGRGLLVEVNADRDKGFNGVVLTHSGGGTVVSVKIKKVEDSFYQ